MRARLAVLLLSCASCRQRLAAPADVARDASDARDAAVARAPDPAPAPPQPVAAWCWRSRPRVGLRAIDTRGAVWSVTAGRLTDETHQQTTALPEEIPCQQPGAWSLEFAPNGSAFLLADSRFYVRPSESSGFSVTPLCGDVRGAPWAHRAAGGWSFISHRSASVEPTLMLTNHVEGDTGWFAITGLDATTAQVMLDERESFLSLSGGGHLIFVDRANTVAGEVIAAQGETFAGLTRTAAGVVAFRDDPSGGRTVVFAEGVAGPFARAAGTRPPGPAATAVFRVELSHFLAVTPAGVELSTDGGAHYARVLSLPDGSAGESPLAHPSVGWLDRRHLAVAGVGGVASERCPD